MAWLLLPLESGFAPRNYRPPIRALLMLRGEDSSFRQVCRVTNRLLEIKRQTREEEILGNPAGGQNVYENTGG